MSAIPPRERTNSEAVGTLRLVPIASFGTAANQHPYSITLSARANIEGGTVRPSALAVFRLMTSSYLVGACTGRSAGFFALEDAAIDITGCEAILIVGVGPEGRQTSLKTPGQ